MRGGKAPTCIEHDDIRPLLLLHTTLLGGHRVTGPKADRHAPRLYDIIQCYRWNTSAQQLHSIDRPRWMLLNSGRESQESKSRCNGRNIICRNLDRPGDTKECIEIGCSQCSAAQTWKVEVLLFIGFDKGYRTAMVIPRFGHKQGQWLYFPVRRAQKDIYVLLLDFLSKNLGYEAA